MEGRRVAIVGAGAAGLCAARHALAAGWSPVVLERAARLGGTWVYTEETGYDSHGLPIHTSMYKSLRTNLPKEVMGFPDYPVPASDRSYLPAKDMLAFLQSYADDHGVTQHIKFHHYVQMVSPLPAERGWRVQYKDLVNRRDHDETFDAIMICNGHYNTPYVPPLTGIDSFKGMVMHSHDYREPSVFSGLRVLVVGAGPSGMDIALESCAQARTVLLSHHLKDKPRSVFPNNLKQKPDVLRMEGNIAHFTDGTTEEVDAVFFCTGYLYNFPFLSPDCGVSVEDNCVQPLYKHLVNIEHPSMCLVGIPYYVCAFSMFDLQVRYFIRALQGHFQLPNKEEMRAHAEQEAKEREERGYSKRQAHMMGPDQERYYASLSMEAGVSGLPAVLTKIREESSLRFLHDLQNYRRDLYHIIDDHTYSITNQDGEIIIMR